MRLGSQGKQDKGSDHASASHTVEVGFFFFLFFSSFFSITPPTERLSSHYLMQSK